MMKITEKLSDEKLFIKSKKKICNNEQFVETKNNIALKFSKMKYTI